LLSVLEGEVVRKLMRVAMETVAEMELEMVQVLVLGLIRPQ
jgi:hypothetical protein